MNKAIITEEGVEINGVKINEKIFQEEMCNYRLEDREDFIETLIDWISEARGRSDQWMMKEDLKELINWDCDFIFSSILTNEYINPKMEEWDEICGEILKLNEELK